MSLSLLQKGTRVTFSGTSTPSVTFGSSCTSGSTIVAEVSDEDGTGTFASIGDTTNGNYTKLTPAVTNGSGGGGDGAAILAYKTGNSNTGAATVNFVLGAGSTGVVNAYEISASSFDQEASVAGTSAQATVTITGVGANAFIVASAHKRFSGSTADSGYTSDYVDINVNSGQHNAEYIADAGASGNKTLNFSDTNSQPAFEFVAASFVASGGGGAMAGTTTLTFGQTGALTAVGALAGSTPLVFGQTGALTGKGALAGSTPLVFGQTGALTGSGALVGTTTLVFGQSGTLTPPAGSMAGQADLTFGATGTMTGIGAMAGTASITFGASASTDSGQSSGFGPMGAFSPSGYFPMATGVGFNKPKKIKELLEEIEEIEPQSPKIETKRPILTLKKPRVNIEELIAIQARITALADFAQSTQDQLRSKQLEEEALMLLLLM